MRTCEKAQFSGYTLAQKLLKLSPGEASDVVVRLPKDEAEDYENVKSSFLRKYRLSAEAFRQKFREAKESYWEFACKLRANIEEWLKEAKAFGEHYKVVECFGVEQSYRRLAENVRHWAQDRPGVNTVDRAAHLADEFVAHRGAQEAKNGQEELRQKPEKSGTKGGNSHDKREANGTVFSRSETDRENEKGADADEQRR